MEHFVGARRAARRAGSRYPARVHHKRWRGASRRGSTLALTARTLRQSEFIALRKLAGSDPAELNKAAGQPIYGVVDFVASADTARAGVAVLAKGGSYIPVGLYGGDLSLPLPTIPLRALTVRGSYTGSLRELQELVDLAKAGKVRAMPIERVSHDNPNTALDRVRSGDVKGRLVLDADFHA